MEGYAGQSGCCRRVARQTEPASVASGTSAVKKQTSSCSIISYQPGSTSSFLCANPRPKSTRADPGPNAPWGSISIFHMLCAQDLRVSNFVERRGGGENGQAASHTVGQKLPKT